jgi:hypothetical protein
MRESNCVITTAVSPMIIVAAPSDCRKSGVSIHADRPVAVADFEMKALNSVGSRPLDEVVEESAANAPALSAGEDRDEQELGFSGYGAGQGKTDRFFAVR